MFRDPATVITGAGRGIGAATALRLAEGGHHLVLNYLQDGRSAERGAAKARAAGVEAIAVKADVAGPDGVEELFAGARERFGRISGLVNNAGNTLHIGPLTGTPVETIRRVIEVNLLGAVLCCRAAAQLMSTASGGNGGVIVNVSSAAATTGSPGEYVHYAAAKAGVDALTMGLAKELAQQGIRVNGVAPGPINTEIHAAAGDPCRLDRIAGRIPFGRVGEPDEVAGVIAWLLGPDAGYVSGTTIRIAGGM
jgi:NAD(P)-dependent dehydrogenase (short-subunit alcohol dehydrogenase family)